MKKYFLLSLVFSAVFIFVCFPAFAQEDLSLEAVDPNIPDAFYKAKVVEILSSEENSAEVAGAPSFNQVVKVELLDKPYKGERIDLSYGGFEGDQKLEKGEKVFVAAPNGTSDFSKFHIFERYRLTSLYWIGAIFVAITIFFARWRGLSSLLGLGLSISVLAFYVVPKILTGQNPLLVTLVGALFIAVLSLYTAHGFNRRTSVALGSTLITIVFAITLSSGFVWLTRLSGVGSEEALFLQTSPAQGINLQGLLLGGIIIGALGVLDDITTGQAAAVDEIHKANPKLRRRELFRRGLSVGKEHITSLVNTLALAYAGASFPALLLFITGRFGWF